MTERSQTNSGLWDNHKRGVIGDFLKDRIKSEAELSFVSAYFTIYAYQALKTQLDSIGHLRFLFGEPRFIQSLDPDKTESKAFCIEKTGLALGNRLGQKRVARECADWIRQKADIRSITRPGFLHGKMYYINNHGVSEAIIGSSNFTVRGLGLGAIVRPGVIFCLKHEAAQDAGKPKSVNPLSPYYLLYVRDDGEVRFTFVHAKQVLTMYQALCRGQTEPIKALCDLFDTETDNGTDMSKYNKLLGKAVDSVVRTFQRRTAAGLQSGRDFVIPDKSRQVSKADDFELVTWLVIK